MHCYYCDLTGFPMPAIAVCQRCGSAVCREHLRELRHPETPKGVTAAGPAWTEHVCKNCMAMLRSSHQDHRAPARADRATALPTDLADLPDARALVQSMEAWLRQTQRAPHARSRHFWSTVHSWLARFRNRAPATFSPSHDTSDQINRQSDIRESTE